MSSKGYKYNGHCRKYYYPSLAGYVRINKYRSHRRAKGDVDIIACDYYWFITFVKYCENQFNKSVTKMNISRETDTYRSFWNICLSELHAVFRPVIYLSHMGTWSLIEIQAFVWHLQPLSRKISLSCHTCCETESLILWSHHQKEVIS